MIREQVTRAYGGNEPDFAWRGSDVSRLESFSDVVFGFAVTLLVVSLEVPRTFDEMLRTMRGFLAFGISFYILVLFWYGHYKYFRRYGLEDSTTLVLNIALLFVIVFFVYPLKFLFTLLSDQILGTHVQQSTIQGSQFPMLLAIYGGGFIAVEALFILLYLHAYRKRDELVLTPLEVFKTWDSIFSALLNVAVALASILVAVIGGPALVDAAGWTYLALLPAQFALSRLQRTRYRRLTESQASADRDGHRDRTSPPPAHR